MNANDPGDLHRSTATPRALRGGTGVTNGRRLRGGAGRVLVAAPQPFYEDRGTPIALRQVLAALVELGAAVDVVCYPVGRDIELPGVRIFRCANPAGIRSVPIGFSLRKLVLDMPLVALLWRRLQATEYACIHALEEAAFPALVLGRRFDVPVIYDMQSSIPEQLEAYPLLGSRPAQAALRGCERWTVRGARTVAASFGLGARVAALRNDAVCHEWVFPAQRVRVGRRDVTRLREDLGIRPEARVVLYSGSFARYQGLPLLLEAIPRVISAHADVVFVLLGAENGDELPAELVDAIPARCLRVVRRQPRARVPLYHALADILVSPRLHGKNFPLKLFDYLATGRPIVATDIAAHRAVLREGTALLAEATPARFAAAIRCVLGDAELASSLSAMAMQYAEERLSWRAFVRSVRRIYRQAGLDARDEILA